MWKGFFDIREYMGKNFNFKQISNSYVIQEPNQVGQAIKSVGRMTWHQEPKKDVTSCEKLRLGANIHRPADIRMGEPFCSNVQESMSEFIAHEKATR